VLDLPDHAARVPHGEKLAWRDGFEIETVISCRFAAAKVEITEVASVARSRVFGGSNLRAVQDGLRVLRTLVTEWRRARAQRRVRRKLTQPVVAGGAPVKTRLAA
jgi:hypothetical protein